MKEKLINLMQNAYDPYYNFPVGCILVCNDLQEFTGVNVGNANGTSICAERNAIHAAIASGYKKNDFKEIYIMANKLTVPCFACRQVFVEFFNPEMEVIAYDPAGNTKRYTVGDLCPYAFTKEDLQ